MTAQHRIDYFALSSIPRFLMMKSVSKFCFIVKSIARFWNETIDSHLKVVSKAQSLHFRCINTHFSLPSSAMSDYDLMNIYRAHGDDTLIGEIPCWRMRTLNGSAFHLSIRLFVSQPNMFHTVRIACIESMWTAGKWTSYPYSVSSVQPSNAAASARIRNGHENGMNGWTSMRFAQK